MYIGIDFGTCFSYVSFVDSDGQLIRIDLFDERLKFSRKFPREKFLEYQDKGVPSIMLCQDIVYSGLQCYEMIYLHDAKPKDVLHSIKTEVRNNIKSDPWDEIPNWAGRITKQEAEERVGNRNRYTLIRCFIVYMLKLAIFKVKENMGLDWDGKVDGITICMPGVLSSSNNRSQEDYEQHLSNIIKDAIKSFDFKKLMDDTSFNPNQVRINVIFESEAAAYCYLKHKLNKLSNINKGNILVIDIGGGTTDFSLVGFNKNNNNELFSTKHIAGDGINLGGNDFDDCLKECLKEKIISMRRKDGNSEIAIDNIIDSEDITKLKEDLYPKYNPQDVEKVSYELSNIDMQRLGIASNELIITKQDFENRTKDLIKKLINKLTKFINENENKKYKIDRVFCTGGASRMTHVQKAIFNIFGEDITDVIPKGDVIAKGAAYYSYNISNNNKILNSTAINSYGILYEEDDDIKKIDNIIYKNDEFEIVNGIKCIKKESECIYYAGEDDEEQHIHICISKRNETTYSYDKKNSVHKIYIFKSTNKIEKMKKGYKVRFILKQENLQFDLKVVSEIDNLEISPDNILEDEEVTKYLKKNKS